MARRKQRGRRYSVRDNALELIRLAAFNGLEHIATRIYVAERISRREFNEHITLGRIQRAEKQRETHAESSAH